MNDLVKYAGCNRTSLDLPENLDKESWLSVGRSLREIGSGVMWWLGDWIRFGDEKWGEKCGEANSLGFAYQTALIAASAPESVSEPRIESVPISHEAMNISLRADLNRAEATVEALRAQLKEAEQANEELFDAKKTIYDLKEKIVSLQNENADLKRKLEDARMAAQEVISEIEKLKKSKSGSKGNLQKSKPATEFSL
jgi:hypothetical protein